MSERSFCLFLPLPFFLFAALAPTAHPMSFSFPGPGSSISCGEKEGICLQGNASYRNGVISLTAYEYGMTLQDSIGWAYYTKPLLLWDNNTRELTNFFTTFDFVIKNQTTFMGDGMAFFLSPYPYNISTDSGGESLGLMSGSMHGNTMGLVAIEFDTFVNGGWDPDSLHIGIDINSLKSTVTKSIFPSNYVGEISGSATVSYDANSHSLSVIFYYKGRLVSMSHIVDLRTVLPSNVVVGFSAATGTVFESHSIVSWVFNSTLDDILRERNITSIADSLSVANITVEKRTSRVGLLVGIGIGVGLVMVVAGLALFGMLRRRNNRRRPRGSEIKLGDGPIHHLDIQDQIVEDLEGNTGPRPFTYKQLAAAANNFTDNKKLGGGGFGTVYKGYLSDLSLVVAIKRLSKDSKQGFKEYASEVGIISKLRHKNLVKLEGWCHELSELLLVYEYMANGSLEDHLFTNNKLLSWSDRYNISLGLASALLYLHSEWDKCIVHRDIKASNVMLDDDYNAKLGDFGLARLIDHGSAMKSTVMAGTLGYLAPECLLAGRSTQESDVYSYGIVLLEIASGRRSFERAAKMEKAHLLNWVWSLYESDEVLQAADERLKGEYDHAQMERVMAVGLWCANPDPDARPSMRQVMAALSFDVTAVFSLPRTMPKPAYSFSRITADVGEISSEISSMSASSYSATLHSSASELGYSSTLSSKSTSSSSHLLS